MTTLRHINCSEASDRAAFFVLGALDPREAAEVREHLETCSRAHEEFAEIGGVVPHLAELADPVEPPAGLRERILGAVEADVRARRREGDAAERLVASFGAQPSSAAQPREPLGRERPRETSAGVAVGPGLTVPDEPITAPEPAAPAPAAAQTPAPAAPPAARPQPTATSGADPTVEPVPRDAPIPIRRPSERIERRRPPIGRWLLAAAAVMAIVGLAGWNVLLQSQAAQEHRRVEALAQALAARNTPNATVAVLSGTDAAPGASGTAVMPPGRSGYLVVQGLRPAPAGKTYQAWFMSGEQARSAGLLTVGDDGMGVLAGLEPGASVDAMAVTLENAGGVERSSEPPLVFGRVTSPGS